MYKNKVVTRVGQQIDHYRKHRHNRQRDVPTTYQIHSN